MKYKKTNSIKNLISMLLVVLLLLGISACGNGEGESYDESSLYIEETSQSEGLTLDEVKALLERDRLITDMFVNNSLCFKESAEYTAVGSSNLYSDFNKLRELLITTYTESGGCIDAFLQYPSKELPAIKGINGRTYTFTHKGSTFNGHIDPETAVVSSTADVDRKLIEARTEQGITVEMTAARINGRWLLEKGIYHINPPTESEFSLKFGNSGIGSLKDFSGKILVIELFVSDKTSKFDSDTERAFHEKVEKAFEYISSEASKYGASADISYESAYYEHSEDIGPRPLDFDIVFAETGFGTLEEFANTAVDLTGYDNYVFAVCRNTELETSCAYYEQTKETEAYFGERVLMGSNATVDEICISMLSVMGASGCEDREYDGYVKELFAKYFPNDITVKKSVDSSEMSVVTAYACGITDELPSLYRVFYYE